tara:strand:- start:1304 stop:1417 length:114 start_codon:yes stop_codon:yes gene_type:complete
MHSFRPQSKSHSRPCQRNKIDEKAEQDAALAQLLAEF